MRVHATRFCFLLLLGFAAAAGDAPRAALAGAAAGSLALASPAGLLDHVTALPGLPASALEAGASSTYAGYVDLPGTQRSLFYALEMSARNPEKDPLVLWLNGGPGCSSVGGGFLSELGPFFPTADGTLQENPWAWTKTANVVFLDSPAFVGFSYSNSSADKVVGDARTAADARAFLLSFIANKFPGFAASPLYIAGESYAGHYIPNLAAAIVAGNAAASAHTPEKGFINLQGIMIGNAWTDATIDNLGAAEHWFSHYMISHSTFESMISACNFSEVGPIKAAGRANVLLKDGVFARKPASAVDDCDVACDNAMQEMGPVNIYQLFADVCVASGTARSNGAQLARTLAGVSTAQKVGSVNGVESVDSLAARSLARAREVVAYWAGVNHDAAPAAESSEGSGSGFPAESPCIDDFVDMYLNRADVREALHVRPNAGIWSVCTDEIDYSVDDLLSSMLPLYPKLIAAGLRIWIFSGDIDGIVPTSGSRAWVEGLRLKELEHWRPWLVKDGALGPQVGGYVTRYEGLTFATVRGAGHMVPYTQPLRAAHLFKAFIDSAPL